MEMVPSPFQRHKKILLQNECNHNFLLPSLSPPSSFLLHFLLLCIIFPLSVCCTYLDVWLCRDLYSYECKLERNISYFKVFLQVQGRHFIGELAPSTGVCVCEEVGYTECSRKRVANTKKKIELFFHDTSMRSTTCSLISCNHQISFCAVCEGLSAEHNLTPNASA